jgi:NADH-quinone oxidoreductase subunit H
VVSGSGADASAVQILLPVVFQTLFLFGAVVLALVPLVERLRIRQGGTQLEDPGGVPGRTVGRLAPLLAVVAPLMVVAVIPYGGRYAVGDGFVHLAASHLDWGLLYVVALLALASAAPVLAARAAGGDGALQVGLRAATQGLSFSVCFALSVAGVSMLSGSLQLTQVAIAQDMSFQPFAPLDKMGFGIPAWLAWVRLPSWGIFLQPFGCVLAFVSLLGALRRPPLDSPEAEFGLRALVSPVEAVVVAALMTTLFLGAFSIPFLPQAELTQVLADRLGPAWAPALCMGLQVVCFLAKLVGVLWLQVFLARTRDRLRFDEVMDLCWLRVAPLALANTFVTGLAMLWLGVVVS